VLDAARLHDYSANHVATKKEIIMNRIRLVVIGLCFTFALTALAQQATTGASDNGVPAVEGHLKLFTEKLTLSADQQSKIRPILREMHDDTQKFVKDGSPSQEERLSHVRASRSIADKKIRQVLNDEQKKNLDELEHEMHPELHSDVAGMMKR
jgi:hypothetical protein